MKTFIGKLFVFVILFFSADFLLGNIIGNFHQKTKNAELQNANYGFVNYNNDDILFFGASEVSHSFISNKIIEKTGLSSYNLATDGCGMYYQYPLLETILEKHTPKVILISASELTQNGSEYITRMYPYYKNNKYVKHMVDELHPREHLKLALHGYVYNSQIIRIFDGRFDNLKGYVPHKTINDNIKNQNFMKFLEKVVSSGAVVYVYVPPVLEKINTSYLNTIKELTKNAGATLIDFSTDYYLLHHKELFNDNIHLNYNGAELLMDKFLKILKEDHVY